MNITRREVLRAGAGALGAIVAGESRLFAQTNRAAKAPSLPVAIAKCSQYELKAVHESLARIFDQIGGIRSLVNGKTVAIKLNLTGSPGDKMFDLPPARTYQTHPNVALATVDLLFKNGAKRVRLLESAYWDVPMEEYVVVDGYDPKAFASLGDVEWEDTHNLGKGKIYSRLKVPWGGYMYPSYDLNHSYVDCDVYVSLAKLKDHVCGGVTLSLKNNFGIAPTAIYGSEAHRKGERALSARVDIFHDGKRQPPGGVPGELDSSSPRDQYYRVPRIVIDLCGIRPTHLAIIDGIESCAGGEGPWLANLRRTTPGVLVAGLNPVNVDAVCCGIMGYDPMAEEKKPPFPGTNHLQLAADVGMGTNDIRAIEVRGVSIKDAYYPYRA